MSGVKKFINDTLIYGLTTILSRMLGFVITPILTRNFPSASYGIFNYMYAYASLLNAVLAFGMETTFFRYIQKFEGDKKKVYDSSFFVTLITALIFVVSVFVFAEPIANWLGSGDQVSDYILYVKLVGLIIGVDAMAVVPFAKLRSDGRPIRFGAVKVINILTYLGITLFFLYGLPWLVEKYSFWQDITAGWFRKGWIGNIFIANLVASLVTLLMLLPQLSTFRFRIEKTLLRSMLWYSFPIMIANISFIINENLDKMMIPRLMPGKEGIMELGIYGAATKMAMFLNIFVMAFRLGAEPFFFANAQKENARQTYAQIMKYFVIAMLIVMLGLCANLDWLKYYIPGSKENISAYWGGLFIVPVLLFNYMLLGIYINLSVWYKLSDQTRYGLYISGIGAIVTIILNFLFIPSYSYVGAAVSTTVTYLIMVTLSFIWGQKNYSIPYDVRKIMIYIVIGVGLSVLAFNVNIWLANMILIFFLATVVYLEKDLIRKFLKR